MQFLNRFRRRKKREEGLPKKESSSSIEETDLKKICSDDHEAYEALFDTMFLSPQSMGSTSDEVAEKAEEYMRKGDTVGAAVNYRITGGLAIYEGDINKVKKYFSKYSELTGKKLKILEIPERAVKKAREYYEAKGLYGQRDKAAAG